MVVAERDQQLEDVAFDVNRLTKAGLGALEKDLETEISEKRQEIKVLEKVVKDLNKLAGKDKAEFPIEVEYSYTAAQEDDYITKTAELELEGPDSAEQAAKKLEKQLDRYGRLRDQMVESLKHKRKALGETKADLKDFVGSTRPLAEEVLAVL